MPSLQITQPPPIPMPAAKLHEPQTRWIKHCYRENPRGVNKWQAVTIPRWFRGKVCNHCAMQDRLAKCHRDHDRQNIQQIKVQHIVEERHAAKDDKNAPQTALGFGFVE